ncbi:response regulator [Aquabacterium fontiphilum]|uniref:response regulator n=1 Tax=Aquabacterium fontiphilum TaxID=450365 RepID=UPI001F030611|nr:response regulator [Aquabacterium fontiphilum]
MATILVVDDEAGIRALLSEILSDEGHTVEVAENAANARILRERVKPDLILLDIWMPDVDGITLLKEWSASGQLTMPVIMMSGHGTIDTAVEATKFGAQSFLEKPITMQKLLRSVEQALSKPAAPAGRPAAPVHLATVTPITAAPSYANGGYANGSYTQGASQPGGAYAGAAAAHASANGVRTEFASVAESFHSAPPMPQSAYHSGYGAAAPMHTMPAHVAPAHHAGGLATSHVHTGHVAHAHAGHHGHNGVNGSLHGATGPSHEQLFQLDRPLREARDDFERAYFEFHLAREGGSMTRVAEKTGLERTHLYRKLKQLGVDLGRAKKTGSN